jgi:twinkle protein
LADPVKGAAFLDSQAEKKPRVFGPKAQTEQLKSLWQKGLPSGDKIGWPCLDKHYTVAPGQLTVLTGWPGSGKSEWLDAVLINLSRQGWKFAIFSPENQPVELHIAKLIEKLSGKPFGHGPTERISQDELAEYSDELEQSFGFIEAPGDGALSAQDVIDAAAPFLAQFEEGSKRGLVIDPWNELEHWRPQGLSETEYVSKTLSTVRNWARRNKVHVWIVAHPQKMKREEGKLPIPRPDMISGSQHWWNKGDVCVTVYRDFDKMDSQDVDIYVQKVRFKHIGRPGFVTLRYDRVTGKYYQQGVEMAVIEGKKNGVKDF